MMSSRTIKIMNMIEARPSSSKNMSQSSTKKMGGKFQISDDNGSGSSNHPDTSHDNFRDDEILSNVTNDDELIKCALEIENILVNDRLSDKSDSEGEMGEEESLHINNVTLAEKEDARLIAETIGSFDENLSPASNEETYVATEIEENVAIETSAVEDPEWIANSDNSSSTTENEVQSTQTVEGNENAIKYVGRRTRKKRQRVSKDEWECNVQKRKRCDGVEYQGLGKENGKWAFKKIRRARQLKAPCCCHLSKRKSKLQCKQLNETQREEIFRNFWRKSWAEKNECVRNLVDVEPVKQRKADSTNSRRNSSLYCHLKTTEGLRIRVCKKQFLNTLVIGEWTMLNWVKTDKMNEEEETNESGDEHRTTERNDGKTFHKKFKIKSKTHKTLRKTRATNHKKEAETTFLKSFLESLPNMESHYCRKSSKRMYLEPIWTSKQQLYRFYLEECQKKLIPPLSSALFCNIFEDMNYSLFRPKKDQCDTCLGFETGNLEESVHAEHIRKKDAARSEKTKDKEEGKWVFTMDLQSVLMAPMTKAGGMYYKSKLVVHNFTIFNLKNKDGYCYLWHEGQGGLSANEFASILHSFIMNLNTEKGDEIILYSDGCCYQNRNSTISNMLVLCSRQKEITIKQKYLEKGHTQMECDSMHSVIERKLRNTEIYTPAGYISVCKSARLRPRPYNVSYLTYDFFKCFSNLSFYNSIRPGYKKGDAQVTDIRCLKYNPSGSIEYKINYNDDWQILPRRRQDGGGNSKSSVNIPQLYKETLKIDKKKYDNLQILKLVLEKEFHAFYDSLQYKVQ